MSSAQPVPAEVDTERNYFEVIRFPSDEARRQAYSALIASGKKLSFSTSEINVWNVRTEVVRALLAAKVPFEWLTRDVK
ncbi:MAG: hypothetical protein B7Z73_00250 [Planctomycetia bacterium 21-64-5]|nr:MAG: hypothetical protein B7Z73_00250 [Planctomycetia bacterium 21-64-5]HQU41216.1 hypothetical protein [Pirellulales bacterium]HVA49719.1 hypothetical protein [Pirellulales bacterium]